MNETPTLDTIASDFLLSHDDPDVRAAAVTLREERGRVIRILGLIREAIGRVRLDIKYLVFDLESTKQERNFLMEKYEG
jgi:hypothetical protein